MNDAKSICSVTGRACRCESGAGCVKPRGGPRVDTTASGALLWARTAILRLQNASDALDLALDKLIFERPFPSPEWREAKRRIEAIIRDLETINNISVSE